MEQNRQLEERKKNNKNNKTSLKSTKKQEVVEEANKNKTITQTEVGSLKNNSNYTGAARRSTCIVINRLIAASTVQQTLRTRSPPCERLQFEQKTKTTKRKQNISLFSVLNILLHLQSLALSLRLSRSENKEEETNLLCGQKNRQQKIAQFKQFNFISRQSNLAGSI